MKSTTTLLYQNTLLQNPLPNNIQSFINSAKFQKKIKFLLSNLVLLVFLSEAGAQTLKRESVSSSGSSVIINGASLQQTIGQPYGTNSNYGNKTRFNPGFQQPVFRIETIKTTINAKVFPNPASNQVTIETLKMLENVLVQIMDMNGKLVLNEKLNEFSSYAINCSDWSNGMYLITLSDAKSDLYSSKLIISR